MQPADWSDTARQHPVDPRHRDGQGQHSTEGEHVTAPIHKDGVARLLTVGVGGGGTNAVGRMIEANVGGVEFLAINTDAQALDQCHARSRLRIGEQLTRGLGAGGNPETGRKAAEESYSAIRDVLAGSDMVFITAGMGGGTGTGASPLVAQAAREQGALTVAIVTTPFDFERRRKITAERGIVALREIVDALIVVPNERLMQLAARDMSAFEAYRLADDVLRQGIQGISDLITVPGLINLDFADIRTIMADAGSAMMSMGQASGENRAEEAARGAITNPLLDVDISGARGVVFNITGGDDLTMFEVNRIADIIAGAAYQDANIIFGTVYDQDMAGSLKITVVATGFEPRVAYDRQRQPWTPASVSPAARSGPSVVPVAGARGGTMGQPRVSPSSQSREGSQGGKPAPRPDDSRIPSLPTPVSDPDPLPYIHVGPPVRRPDSLAMTPLQRSQPGVSEDGHEPPKPPKPQRTDEQVRPPRRREPERMEHGGRQAADQRRALVARGYHGDEYAENDESEELELPRETHHGWERLFTRR